MKEELKKMSSEQSNTRRDFLKYSSLLGSVALLSSPVAAMAAGGEAGGKPEAAPHKPESLERGGAGGPAQPAFKPEEIGKALNVLFKTYSRAMPYQHKFNDSLVKAWLNSVDFAVSKKEQKEFVDHYINSMKPILQRAKGKIAAAGNDAALTTMFEGTMCSIQLFEEITVRPNERSFPCPYKGILEVCKPLNMFGIEWKDVCNNFCVPLYTGFGKEMGVEIKMTPGEICSARVA